MHLKIFLYLYGIAAVVDNSVIVTTNGPVLGKFVEFDEGVSYYAYQGIPYAENPGGKMRFKPPIPRKPWLRVLNATKEGPICPQPGEYTKDQMSEDCLTVNIYVPATKTASMRPVYFFIHGGAFKSGSGNIDMYGPQMFLKRNIIYVSLNYRLGALGFLCFKREEAAGNAGIKDVLLALEWINRNIVRFGGKGITIGGQSAGAAIVHYLLLTIKSTGLFQHAVLNSGSATNFRYLSRYPTDTGLALAAELGLPTNDEDELLKKLLNLDAADIVKAQENIYKTNRNIMRPFAPFVPCIENASSHAILTEHPSEIIKSGIPQNIPILLGITSQEGAYMYPTLSKQSSSFLQQNLMLCLPSDIEYPVESKIYKNLMKSIKNIYFGDTSLQNWTTNNFFNLVSDTQYSSSIDSWIRIHLQRNDSKPSFYYVFDFDGDFNWSKLKYNITLPGMAHADDLGYMFVTTVTQPRLTNNLNQSNNNYDKSKRTMKNTLTFLINFIIHGNPTPDGYEGNLKWSECGKQRFHLLLKDEPESILHAPFEERFNFWYKVYEEYAVYLKSGGKREEATTK